MLKPTLRQSTLIQSMKVPIESPPYRKVRALRLFDTPATPKTLFKKSSTESGTTTPAPAQMHSKFIRKPILTNINMFSSQTPSNLHEKPKIFPVHNKALEPLTANINPFSPSSMFFVCFRLTSE